MPGFATVEIGLGFGVIMACFRFPVGGFRRIPAAIVCGVTALLSCVGCYGVPNVALNCFLDGSGRGSAVLYVGTLLTNTEVLPEVLGQVLGTGTQDPGIDIDYEKKVVTCTARSAARIPRGDFKVKGSLQIAPLGQALSYIGSTQVEVNITVPRATLNRCSLPASSDYVGGPWVGYKARIPLTLDPNGVINIEYGYARNDILKGLAWVLIPLPTIFVASLRKRSSELLIRNSWHSLVLLPLFIWAAWFSLVGISNLDTIISFYAGWIDPIQACYVTTLLVVSVPILLSALSFKQMRTVETSGSTASGGFLGEVSLCGASPYVWTVPALFAGIGLSKVREGVTGSWWWSVAIISILVIVGQRWWGRDGASAVDSSRLAGRSGPSVKAYARQVQLRRWWSRTGVLLGIPVTTGAIIQYWQIEQPTSAVAAGAGLAATLTLLRWFPPFRNMKASETSGSAENAAGQSSGGIRSDKGTRMAGILSFAIRMFLAWAACLSLSMPLNLEQSDSGIFAVICVLVVAGWAFREESLF